MLVVKALNGDASFLLVFVPSIAPDTPSVSQFPGAFTVLIDPWLTGPAKILTSAFSVSHHQAQPCVASLADLPEPDMVIISQDKPDHCHKGTLTQLPPDTRSLIVAAPAAAAKIRKWKHFKPNIIHALQDFSETDQSTIFRIQVPSFSPSGSPGQVTVTLISQKNDFTGLHKAIGITYRAPSSPISAPLQLLDTPSTLRSAVSHSSIASALTGAGAGGCPDPSPTRDREPTLSVLYSPHGVPYALLEPYVTSHLIGQAALPLTLLLHAFDRVDNPWFLGGNISTGAEGGGADIAKRLMARAWVAAHDGDKRNRGVGVSMVKTRKMGVEDVRRAMVVNAEGEVKKVPTRIQRLDSGDELRVKGG
ncbi:hypothetical protein IWZ00DRAFT_446845 [Phyllosticta capitalensis]|uniref:Metallo-beta-lactamase domain-containing protein n=1 Tax=Phyllosticta capitalensis TaxID=121624 RepID=A0ABR1YE45_9PEZI